MNFADTHAHLFWDSFQDDFEEVLERALRAGVTTIINVGVDIKTSDIVTKLNSDKVQFLAAIGIHPEEALKYSNLTDPYVSIHEDVSKLEDIYKSNSEKVIAIGECGLDYSPQYIPSPKVKNLQHELLRLQVALAKKFNLPLLIHCRDAWEDTIEMTKDYFGIYHCYSGQPQTTNYILQTTNFLISFAGNLTYPKNEFLRESLKLVPLDRLALETDCPFLPPQSKRGQRNEPSFISETYQSVAQIKKVSLEHLSKQTYANVAKLLSLG